MAAESRENLLEFGDPEYCVVLFRDWSGDAAGELCRAINRGVADMGCAIDSPPATEPEKAIRTAARATSQVLLILDQFEDYFLYHGQETWLPALLRQRDLPVCADLSWTVRLRHSSMLQLFVFLK